MQNADHAFDSLEMVASQLVQADIPALLSDMDQLAAKGKDSLEAMEKAAEVLEKIDMNSAQPEPLQICKKRYLPRQAVWLI